MLPTQNEIDLVFVPVVSTDIIHIVYAGHDIRIHHAHPLAALVAEHREFSCNVVISYHVAVQNAYTENIGYHTGPDGKYGATENGNIGKLTETKFSYDFSGAVILNRQPFIASVGVMAFMPVERARDTFPPIHTYHADISGKPIQLVLP